jgi:hypothetical protein
MTSQQYIARQLKKGVDKYVRQMVCEHRWKKHAFGYICTRKKCGFYTGMSDTLNEIIEKELSGDNKGVSA